MTKNQAKTIGRTFALLIKGSEHTAAEIVIDAFKSKLFGFPNEQREELAAAFNQGSDEFFAEFETQVKSATSAILSQI